jgi:hypothetical protein
MEGRRVTASGLVYLFGEEFAKAAGRFIGGETLLYSGQKVDRKELANRLFEAAFVSLAGEGYISLGTEERKKLLLLTREVVTITEEKKGDDLPPSLERAVMDTLEGDPKQDWVQAVVERVIGGERADPWKWVVGYVMERLVEAGYLTREVEKRRFRADKVHWSAHEEAIGPLVGEVETLKSTLGAFASLRADLHKRLVGEVRAGIKAQEMEVDYD